MPKIAAIQMSSTAEVTNNLAIAAKLMAEAAAQGAQLVVLPEMFAILGSTPQASVAVQEELGNGQIQNFLAEQARRHGIWLVSGTIPLRSPDPHRFYAACLVYNDQGEIITRYDKWHLFDAQLSQNEIYCESNYTCPGHVLPVVDTPWGKLGLAVCYDIRFPELFRLMAQAGAEIFAIPAAFTAFTGRVHWEILLRARAIENFCYVIAADQFGLHANGRKTHGDSLIIDAWGTVLDRLVDGEGVVIAELDLKDLQTRRQQLPALLHQRITVPFLDKNNMGN